MQNTLLAKSAITVHCFKVRLALLLVVVHCLQESKLPVRAGALLTLRKLNSDSEIILS
jgi:hypothetical protein